MNNKQWDRLYFNGAITTCIRNALPYGLIANGALAMKANKIAWVGSTLDLPGLPEELAHSVYDLNGKCVTPGFIDCHTHLVYAGNRCHEFEMRLKGESYAAIANAGGGIRSTVLATRAASEDELYVQSLKRAQAMLQNGVTVIEIKSGYGLNLETELKMLRVAKRIGENLPLTVCATFLGAHTVPLEFANRADDYIHYVCEEMIPRIAEEKLATAVDVFSEKIAFNLAQTERVFATAQKYKLAIKCHAEQLSDSGSAALASKWNAQSVDHLEFLSEEGVVAIAQSRTVAVLLPGAFYFLRESKQPPIALLRQHEVNMAIATDCNPGTSPVTSLLLMLNMACTLFRLTPEEAILGITRHAASALGLEKTHGQLDVGRVADFLIWDVQHPAELAYQFGMPPLFERVSSHP